MTATSRRWTPTRRMTCAAIPAGLAQRDARRPPPGVRMSPGCRLDLGATAKALAADRRPGPSPRRRGRRRSSNLGGDVATAGPAPSGGWVVHVTDDHRAGPDDDGQSVTVSGGGLATSSTTVRQWRRGGRAVHHIVDPPPVSRPRRCGGR